MAATALNSATVPLDDFGVSAEHNIGRIPDVSLSDETRSEMELWIQQEINEAKAERVDIEDRWALIQKLYDMIELEDKDYPFEDSAHLVIQLIATFTETVWAKVINTIFSPQDPFAAKPLRKEFVDKVKCLRKWITWACKEELRLEEVMTSLILEGTKLGTYVAKVVYTQEDRVMRIYDPTTRKFNKVRQRVKDHPEIIHVPLPDILYRSHHKSPDECVWKAHRFTLTWGQVLERKADGRFDADLVDELVLRFRQKNKKDIPQQDGHMVSRTPYEAARDEAIGVQPRANDTFEFYEIWFEYLVPEEEEDLPIKLVGIFEPDSGKLMRIQHNYYPLQLDPFVFGVYIPREHRIEGTGVGDMSIAYQNEITAMHNQRLDNATVANASVVFMQEDSPVPLNLKIKPGGTYGVPNPKEVNVVPLGQKYDSTIAEEKHTLAMVQQRIGLQDFVEHQMGHTSTQAIINMQEATRKFDIVIRNVRRFMTQVMERCLLLYQQHYPDGKPALVLGEEEGSYIEELFKFSQNDLKYGMSIQVTATSSNTAKELERQTKLSLFNMMTQYYGQLTQYVLQAQNPQLPPSVQQTMLHIVESLGILVRDILEDFNEPDPDRLVVDSRDGIVPPVDPASSYAPAAGGVQGNNQPQGMAALQQLLGAAPS